MPRRQLPGAAIIRVISGCPWTRAMLILSRNGLVNNPGHGGLQWT